MPMFKRSLLILLVLALAVLGGTMYGYYSEQQAIALDEGTSAKVETPRSITVTCCRCGERRGRCDRDGGHRPHQYGGVP